MHALEDKWPPFVMVGMTVLGKLAHIKAKVGGTWWIDQGQFALIDAWARV